MVARLASLRLWLLVAMVISAAVGLGGAAILFSHVETSHEHTADAAKARRTARVIADQVAAGADAARLAAIQAALLSDRITVTRGGRIVFQGAPRDRGEFELAAQAPFPGGAVRIDDYSSPGASTTLDLTLIAAGVLVLVIAAAIATATVVTRAVRVPVQRAIDAADRLSQGELSVRMGGSGPEELVRLGRAFDEMAARLERSDRDQRAFLADVAHEIATPINTVSGFALALADGAVDTSAQRDEARALIEAETGRLRDLLRDLRELTQLDLAGEAHPARLALAPFAERLGAAFRPAAAQAGVRLSVSARRGELTTDPRLVELVATNLLSNAIRYTPAGGEVAVRLRRRGSELVLGVRDSGVGIAPEHQRRIFERLYRVDGTRDRATGGSGLGLAIAARAARSLGGRIELDSTPGQGSEFWLVVPDLSSRSVDTDSVVIPRRGA